ncbi:MAG: hypothetical protein HQ517_08680 [SAR324 cluster bacterium]|nr:hypothetical protein [SAR324 cluster bacterium]
MEKINPRASKSQESSGITAQSNSPELIVRFISLIDRQQIEGIDVITNILDNKNFAVDHFEYKVIKRTETRRPINLKFKDGPSEKVVLEERINVNSNLKTIRQLEWRVTKDPENVLLLNIARAKGEALCLPLIFPNIFKKEHSILVTGLNATTHLQLLAKPDLQFKTIPQIVLDNPEFKEQLLQRASRSKGMQATARELLDFSGLPEKMVNKISQLATGKKETLSDAQSINLMIFSDLVTRYLPVILTFQNDVLTKSGSVAQLSKQFMELTEGIPTQVLVSKLGYYVGDEGGKQENNEQVFSHLYQRLQQMKDGKLFVKGALLDVKTLFGLLRSLICINRSQIDPGLWGKCLYFLKPFDAPNLIRKNMAAIYMIALASQKKIILNHAASNRSLMEIFTVHNIQNFVIDKKVFLSKESLSDQEYGIIRSAVLRKLGLKQVKVSKHKDGSDLFADPGFGPSKLYNPVHCVGSSFGYLLGSVLKKNLERFLQQDIKALQNRFGKNLFDIFYEQAVFEKGLPISRNVFGKWLEARTHLTKIDKLGYISNDLETSFDPSLTPQIIVGNGQSIFEADFTTGSFAQEYLENRIQYFGFLDKLQKIGSARNDSHNSASIFLKYIEKGEYDILSPHFRDFAKQTFLYEELGRIVSAACGDIQVELNMIAKNNKVILKLPLKYESILYLGNTFEVELNSGPRIIRLQVVAQQRINEKRGVFCEFATKFDELMQQSETPERKGLIQAIRILGEYQKISRPFFKFLILSTLDRQMHVEQNALLARSGDPGHLKFGMSDAKKLVTGSMRTIKLDSVLQYDQEMKRNSKDAVDNLSFAQMLESIMYWKSVKKDLAKRAKNVSIIIQMMGRFSKTLKEGEEWITYHKMVLRFFQLISQPVDKFGDNVIQALTDISGKMSQMVSKREYKDNAIAILYAEWKRKYPGTVKNIYFYAPFVDEDGGTESNLLQELRNAARLSRMLLSKKCLIFLLEAAKQAQQIQMGEIIRFLRQEKYDLDFFVETSTLDETKLNELSKTILPKFFFQAHKLQPQKRVELS